MTNIKELKQKVKCQSCEKIDADRLVKISEGKEHALCPSCSTYTVLLLSQAACNQIIKDLEAVPSVGPATVFN